MKSNKIIGFKRRLSLRIIEQDRVAIQKIVDKSQDLYDNESHFIRCAVRRLIRQESKRLKIVYVG